RLPTPGLFYGQNTERGFPLLTSSDVVFLLATALCGRFSQVHIISTDAKGIACTCQVVWQVCQLFIQWMP
ncbi:TPA: hypothetical protein ACI7JD_004340, partial [Escherichia coli]